ncbi:MAG TPA: ATPase P [Candidatus Copromorpha excrementigallinarum]|uniref:ATPase P n=1 Tax=Candidatus Allocopromorpha excrementigallinarum TaxID=2840742 RepID=A0A9D1HZ20_9FIRM|nr:ATPase P [Candidatus Copromorpha excrementigallinarum]
MIFKAEKLGSIGLPEEAVQRDRRRCRRAGSCGVGEKAVYLGGLYRERKYYIPYDSIERIFKRVAMSRGGFTGRGAFASLSYLVVEYDGGKEYSCLVKREEDIDSLLEQVKREHPHIRVHSADAERKLLEKRRRLSSKLKRQIPLEAKEEAELLQSCREYLEKKPALYRELSLASRSMRAYENSRPVYRWTAMVITAAGAASLIYGIYSFFSRGWEGAYFVLFGLAAIFFFSGMSVLPTGRNNRKRIERRLRKAEEDMEKYLKDFSGFPIPARYAHPAVLGRMEEIIAEKRASSSEEALEILKDDLKRLNSNVQVEQEEYEEITAIKPMFLINRYR